MPFVARRVEPRLLGRGHVPATGTADWPVGAELEAVANGALAVSLRQLASLLSAAEDVFGELTRQLTSVADRGRRLHGRIDVLEQRLAAQDPKKIPVPESDLCTFATRKEHFSANRQELAQKLFTLETRPASLRRMYEAAASIGLRSLDSLRRERDALSPIDMFICTPVMSKRYRRERSLDIEARRPRAVEKLRRWTSAEALGDVTVAPDCASRILSDDSVDDSRPVDHKLPSPEEQLQAVALKFPAELVAVDVSGRGFHRMSIRRRSLQQQQQHSTEAGASSTVRRRSRVRKPRGKRRNTIAGTDHHELRQAATETSATEAQRSASTDLLDSNISGTKTLDKKSSHFDTLKAWGRSRLKLISPKSSQQNHTNGSTTSLANGSTRQQAQMRENEFADDGTYESLAIATTTTTTTTSNATNRRSRRESSKSHERMPSSSSSSSKSTNSSIRQPQASNAMNGNCSSDQQPQLLDAANAKALDEHKPTSIGSKRDSVRLRESAAERRERRKARADEPPHSSSGNWSASSESGRASVGSSETTTTTTTQPRSTRRLKAIGRGDTSASSASVTTSEGTLTPDIIHQDMSAAAAPFSDDGETSSVYSCDTEGYYTSFHMDSGLKTLREEEPATGQPQSPLMRSNEVTPEAGTPPENEYELYGRGSTSTTTSSAGTVCTTLLAPAPPERKSSLSALQAMVQAAQKQARPQQQQQHHGGESPDSGHNTSSSPVESASSPACTGRSCSEFEYSESSDLEGCERIERIRSKTAINTSRIPSMCVITPPNSDDERSCRAPGEQRRQQQQQPQNRVLMSATVGTSKMQVINGQDKNLYATVQTLRSSPAASPDRGTATQNPNKISPLSGVLGKLRGVLPGRKQLKSTSQDEHQQQQLPQADSGDYVTIADVRNNARRQQDNATTPVARSVTYANSDLFRRDAEYVSLSELPKKADSSLERRRQGARVTLDSEGKVVYSSDSLKRRKAAHTTFIPGPFVKEGNSSPAQSPLLRRSSVTPRAVTRSTTCSDSVDGQLRSASPQHQQPGKTIIRANKSSERASSPEHAQSPTRVVSPASTTTSPRHQAQQGAYVNVQGEPSKDQALLAIPPGEQVSTATTCPTQQRAHHEQLFRQQQAPPAYVGPPQVARKLHEQCSEPRDNRTQQSLSNANNNINQSHHRQQQQQRIFDPYQRFGYDNRYALYSNNNNNNNNNANNYESNEQNNNNSLHRKAYPCEQFYTLPNRRPEREVVLQQARSITPDLGRQKPPQLYLSRSNLQQFEGKLYEQQPRQTPADAKNRFASPVGWSGLGYRAIAASALAREQPPISPIGPQHCNGFQSSTPSNVARVPQPSVAERLALQSQRCCSPNPALPASKSSMSNEELFAAIHRSKRKLSLAETQNSAASRHSWSPPSHQLPEVPKSVLAPSATSRMDFKRLLLQQSVKCGPTRLSAAEQLKLSRQQQQQQQCRESPTRNSPARQLTQVQSPRSAWRFQKPRSDVLSSTIIEEAAAEERASRPSPEATMARRQLDLGGAELKSRASEAKRALDKCEKELENRLQLMDPRGAIESRRLSNQLARAQFLAAGPIDVRSQTPPRQSVASISSPALETAL